jgi:hypothetical protein
MGELKQLSATTRGVALGPAEGLRGTCGSTAGKTDLRVIPCPSVLSFRRQRQFHMQVSRFNRALPEPSGDVLEVAAEQHIEVLTSEWKCSHRDLQSFESFCRAEGRRGGKGRLGMPGTSSCLEKAVVKGGLRTYVSTCVEETANTVVTHSELMRITDRTPAALFGEYKLLPEFVPDYDGEKPLDTYLFPLRKDYELEYIDWCVLRRRLLALFWAYLSFDPARPLRCKQVVLPERGYKVRVVTPGEGAVMLLGSVLNSMCLSNLRRSGVHPQLHADGTTSVANACTWVGSRHRWVRSMDLKSASDYLPMGLTTAGFRGLADGLGLDGCWSRLGEIMLGSHVMSVERGKAFYVTSRAALMGSPITWPVLSLYVAWLHHEARSWGWHQVVGDDYIGCLTRSENRRFNRALRRTGGLISFGKDYYVSSGYGVLCEELVDVQNMRVWDTVSVRAMVGMQKAGSTEPRWSLGPTTSDRCARWGEEAGKDIVACWFTSEFEAFRSRGVDPCAPRGLMGAGFPGTPSMSSLRVARVLVGHTGKEGFSFRTDVGRAVDGCWYISSSRQPWWESAFRHREEVLIDEFCIASRRDCIWKPDPAHKRWIINGPTWVGDGDGMTDVELHDKWASGWKPASVVLGSLSGVYSATLGAFGGLAGPAGRDLRSQRDICDRLLGLRDRVRVRGHWAWSELVVDPDTLLEYWRDHDVLFCPRGLRDRNVEVCSSSGQEWR